MENFNWSQFSKKVAVKASLTEMYDAWSVANNIEKWFLSDTDYKLSDGSALSKSARFESGTRYEWHWFLYDEVETGEILEANGKDFIKFEFANSIVEITLTELDEYVIVELIQNCIPTDEKSKQDIRLGCEKGWTFFLLNLRTVYENDIDQRNQDGRLKGMINN
jgi:uncharacterized protein YndB with AHSA1/START domain